MRTYLHFVVYIIFAGLVSIVVALIGAYLTVDHLIRHFVKHADYLRSEWSPSE